MKIYTRSGDQGRTSLIGKSVYKDDERVEAYGSVDELNAFLGFVISLSEDKEVERLLLPLQNDLFVIGAELAGDKKNSISELKVRSLEDEIDRISEKLPPLHSFILPGGSKTAAALHLARTVCRRTERRVVSLSKKAKINPSIIAYLNRMGDFLFVLARYINYKKRLEEKKWKN